MSSLGGRDARSLPRSALRGGFYGKSAGNINPLVTEITDCRATLEFSLSVPKARRRQKKSAAVPRTSHDAQHRLPLPGPLVQKLCGVSSRVAAGERILEAAGGKKAERLALFERERQHRKECKWVNSLLVLPAPLLSRPLQHAVNSERLVMTTV
ncbi:hypothetical protein AAFF_G00158820 [Aldrovandia affinis]|uniref:Uncharacterized protein n=1 Tax=Aldrovandia affinis TaxID=143900 RepID=A0AAD7RN56_9TELE|nr:hypothetical protein AAFF_G00158820 [Aldrovandia affinis]